MEEKTFAYSSLKTKVITVAIFVILFALREDLSVFFWIGTILFLPLLYRIFCISITFTDKEVIYRGLFKKTILKNENIKDIVVIKRKKRYAGFGRRNSVLATDIISYTEYIDDSLYIPQLMIGHFDYYPSNWLSLFFKPSGIDYITIMYREELVPYLDRLVK